MCGIVLHQHAEWDIPRDNPGLLILTLISWRHPSVTRSGLIAGFKKYNSPPVHLECSLDGLVILLCKLSNACTLSSVVQCADVVEASLIWVLVTQLLNIALCYVLFCGLFEGMNVRINRRRENENGSWI